MIRVYSDIDRGLSVRITAAIEFSVDGGAGGAGRRGAGCWIRQIWRCIAWPRGVKRFANNEYNARRAATCG